ncbi:MAG: hypothetical protein PUC94_08095, partial [Bacteroidales bacterium]|nr:hypothetical protein [Bacteroidales bacterium]
VAGRTGTRGTGTDDYNIVGGSVFLHWISAACRIFSGMIDFRRKNKKIIQLPNKTNNFLKRNQTKAQTFASKPLIFVSQPLRTRQTQKRPDRTAIAKFLSGHLYLFEIFTADDGWSVWYN